jgi:F0F1-type ATP synthase assembly protein I
MRTREIRQILQAFGLLTQLGITIVVAILLGVGLGIVLGRMLGWPLLGLLLGVILGVGGAGVGATGVVGQLLAPTAVEEESPCPQIPENHPPTSSPS